MVNCIDEYVIDDGGGGVINLYTNTSFVFV